MPLKEFLESCSREIVERSPIRVVYETTPNNYLYVDPTQLETVWADEDQLAEAPATEIQTKTLTSFSKTLWKPAGSIALDEATLSAQRPYIFTWAGNWIGACCFHMVKKANLKVTQLTSAHDIDDPLQNLTLGNLNDVSLIANPRTLNQLKSEFLRDRIWYQSTGKIQINNLIDQSSPVFSPHTRDAGVIVFNWDDTFVLSAPNLEVRDGRLIFNFKFGVQNIDRIRVFKI